MTKKKHSKKHTASPKRAAKPTHSAAPKHTAKPKESNKFWVWAVVVVVVVILLFLMRGAKQAPQAPTGPAAPEQAMPQGPAAPEEAAPSAAQVPETAPGNALVTEEQAAMDYRQNEDSGLDLTATPERFSNFECAVDKTTGLRMISIKVTNTNSDVHFLISHQGVAKGYNTYFMIRGLTDKDPGCGTEDLAPGESTVCSGIGSDNPSFENVVGLNRITIQSPNDNNKLVPEAVLVEC